MTDPAKFTILSMMKDEGHSLIEWVAYHRVVGFDRICVYTNDCSDGTDEMLMRLEELGYVHHFRNDVPEGAKPQPNALTLAGENPVVTNSEWVLVMDADEFLNVKIASGTVRDLVTLMPRGTDAIAITWRFFGSNGITDWNPGLVTQSYTRAAPNDFKKGWGVKTLFKPFEHMKFGIHRPSIQGARRLPERAQALLSQTWMNGSGKPMPQDFSLSGWRSTKPTLGYELAEMNHYAVKSFEAYLLRRMRGNVNNKEDKYNANYFAIFDRNEIEVFGAQRHLQAVRRTMAEMLQDDTLSALYDAALSYHADRVEALRQNGEYDQWMTDLKTASEVPIDKVDEVLFIQHLPKIWQERIKEMQAKGVPDRAIAKMIADSQTAKKGETRAALRAAAKGNVASDTGSSVEEAVDLPPPPLQGPDIRQVSTQALDLPEASPSILEQSQRVPPPEPAAIEPPEMVLPEMEPPQVQAPEPPMADIAAPPEVDIPPTPSPKPKRVSPFGTSSPERFDRPTSSHAPTPRSSWSTGVTAPKPTTAPSTGFGPSSLPVTGSVAQPISDPVLPEMSRVMTEGGDPAGQATPALGKKIQGPRIHLVSTLKNEGPYLVEWVAHYRRLGVTDFTLFSNDCTDGTNLILNRLAALGMVRHFDNPLRPRMDPQRRAYSRAGKMDSVRQADWVVIVDADEFLNIHAGDGTIPALIEACGDPQAISVPWRLMGSAGRARMSEAPVTSRFEQGSDFESPENGMVWGFKTLFRPKVFDFFGVHRPKFEKDRTDLPDLHWTNASGDDVTEKYLRKGWRFGRDTLGYGHAQINHYAIKSREEFLLKRLRGTANSKDKDRIDMEYWRTFDINTHQDRSITAGERGAQLEKMMQALLKDQDLAALHRASLDNAHRTIAAQLEDAELAEFVETGLVAQKAAE